METTRTTKPSYRTIDAKPTASSLVKPGELVDLVEVTPLTLNDRRVYNLLLENAWDAIDQAVIHSIAKSRLRGSHNSNDRIGDSIERLMRAIVRVRFMREGKPVIERVQLLGGNLEFETPDGTLHYEIPARLRRIIKDSFIFARLQKEVMFALNSKYALTLYEMVQKRGNLTYQSHEDFTLEEFRALLGVPKGKLTTWSNFNNRAIQPAAIEVSQLSTYVVKIEPIKKGRKVVSVRLRWWAKESQAVLTFQDPTVKPAIHKMGAERSAKVAKEKPQFPILPTKKREQQEEEGRGSLLRSETYETARLRYPGYDVYSVEQEWLRWSAKKEPPRSPDKAYLAFFRTFVENNPH